jgi:hypothetical protein
MFWSFNEPLPESGQIRPALSVALQYPPILNTGNRGPIEHQPGDWICKKCNYLNWRRRKVCQTCYPCMVSSLHMPSRDHRFTRPISFLTDAEGNGDSISATVQAERIALLAGTIRGREFHSLPPSPSSAIHERPLRRSSLPLQALPNAQQPSGDVCLHDGQHSLRSRSRSHHGNGLPPSFVPRTAASSPAYANTPPSGPLLPSFLQDIVRSPSLSPASSTDFSLEDYNNEVEPGRLNKFNEANLPYHGPKLRSSLALRSTTSLTNMFNIWKLDGDETKGW